MPTYTERARALRPYIERASASLPDRDAAQAVELFPAWAFPVDYAEGDRRSDGGKLYKCRQAHTSQEDWRPSATPAMWVVIDVEHAGTQDDPIPASRGMEYEYGRYYSTARTVRPISVSAPAKPLAARSCCSIFRMS